MIRFLRIQNFSVVKELELELQPGFTVLTGETGAGKSIVFGALALLVGGRSTSNLVRTGEDKACVQAIVEDSRGNELILRREVNAQGRSRAFINDEFTTVAKLQDIGRRIVYLYGQHDHQTLLDPSNHLILLDAYAGIQNETAVVRDTYRSWRRARSQLDDCSQSVKDTVERVELLTFQGDEIDRVNPKTGEDSTLNAKRSRLVNAERLASLCGEAFSLLYESDDAVLSALSHVWRDIDELALLDEKFAPYASGRVAVESQLEDLAFFLRSYRSEIETSPEELASIESRLAELEHLKRKYGSTLEEVLQSRDRIRTELAILTTSREQLAQFAGDEREHQEQFRQLADALGNRRRTKASELRLELEQLLSNLAIPHARFEVRFNTAPLAESFWTEHGIDELEFFFSANPGETLRPLSKVASGGELSRVMLALKTLACNDDLGRTLVFDEVDAGIGGTVADKMGSMLRTLRLRLPGALRNPSSTDCCPCKLTPSCVEGR